MGLTGKNAQPIQRGLDSVFNQGKATEIRVLTPKDAQNQRNNENANSF